jgi:hypothetical protein
VYHDRRGWWSLWPGSVSAWLGPRELQSRKRLTRWKIERSVHLAVDNTRLEAGVCVAKSNTEAHDTLVEVWYTVVLSAARSQLDFSLGDLHTLFALSPYLAILLWYVETPCSTLQLRICLPVFPSLQHLPCICLSGCFFLIATKHKMTDPLSITASVVGITVPALHGVRLLMEDLQQLKEAPKTIKRLSKDVQSVETSLKLLQGVEEREWDLFGANVLEKSKTIISRRETGMAGSNQRRVLEARADQGYVRAASELQALH